MAVGVIVTEHILCDLSNSLGHHIGKGISLVTCIRIHCFVHGLPSVSCFNVIETSWTDDVRKRPGDAVTLPKKSAKNKIAQQR